MTNTLTKYAKTLRKNSTQADTLLWRRLMAGQLEGIKFRRQQPIGDFIVDSVSFEKRIIIELDGGQHAIAKCKDTARDRWFVDEGFTVLRFWNSDVFENLDGVLEAIRKKCLSRTSPSPDPSPSPSHKGRGTKCEGEEVAVATSRTT
ncbi:MAG: DUF559 domain-containing protein [Desulfobacterales bacterium]